MLKKLIYSGAIVLVILVATELALAATTPTTTIKLPAVPALTIKQAASTAVLQWGKPAKGTNFTGYTAFRSEQAGKIGKEIARPSKTAQTFVDKKVVVGHTYYYTVRYYRAKAVSANGRQVKIKIMPIKSSTTATTTANTTSSLQVGINSTTSPATTPPAEQPNIFSSINPVVPPVTDSKANPHDSERVTTLKQLRAALKLYFDAQTNYPLGNSLILGQAQTSCLNSEGWGSSDDCPYPYFGEIPKDPGSSAYRYTSLGDSYTIESDLEGMVDGLSGTVVATPSGITKK